MMKKIYSFALIFFLVSTCFAKDIRQVPDDFQITQHWLSLTTAFEIHDHHEKLGSLYRRLISANLYYDFYDDKDEFQANARARIFGIRMIFDVFDQNQQIIGIVREKLFSFFPSFSLHAPDNTPLAEASLNFWGTRFTIYDVSSHQEMAHMTRSLFRVKNDWEVHISNRPLFEARGINPYLFLTALAFQGDQEYWDTPSHHDHLNLIYKAHLHQIKQKFRSAKHVNDQRLMAAWAQRWEQRFQETYPDYHQEMAAINLDRMLKIGLELMTTPNLQAQDYQSIYDLFTMMSTI
jgi:hypothetical protein